MSVWLSYTLGDFLLFTPHTYYRLFALYNRAVWPLHLLALALGLALLVLLFRGGASRGVWRGRAVALILAACWLWVAWGYLYERYDTINWAARYFALAFAVQAALLIASGVVLNRLAPGADPVNRAGAALVAFALFVQPLLAPLTGRPWLQMEFFALAPDPTVAATLGALIAHARRARAAARHPAAVVRAHRRDLVGDGGAGCAVDARHRGLGPRSDGVESLAPRSSGLARRVGKGARHARRAHRAIPSRPHAEEPAEALAKAGARGRGDCFRHLLSASS